MGATLDAHSYGKSHIRVAKVARHGDRHGFVELEIDTRLEGDFAVAHHTGDNTRVLPTDTQKNTVYALAAKMPLDPIEAFGSALAARFLQACEAASRALVSVARRRWLHAHVGESLHPHTFIGGGEERRLARIAASRQGAEVSAGLEGLVLLKTSGSRFTGFLRDEYTTLAESDDRIFATSVTARWSYVAGGVDYERVWSSARETLIETFALHDSASAQHTLFAMAERVLERHAEITQIDLSLPNLHYVPVDLRPFKLEHDNEVFQPTSEPHGVIEASVRR
jgi:urate oxidase